MSASPWVDSRYFPWALAGAYLLVVLVLFRDFVFSNLMLYGSDTMQAVVYFRKLYVGSVLDGSFPLWSPYLYGGMPFVDAFHSDIFYPFTFMKFLLPLGRSRGWEVMLHIWLGGFAMYLAARGWRISRPSAALCGLAYMLAPYFVSMVHPGHDGKLYVTAWFPLGFLFIKRLWDEAQWRDAALFGLVMGCIILTPHVQMAYFCLWAYGGYSAYRLVRTLREERRMPWKASAGALAGVAAAIALSAVQFYPSFDYVKNHSPRSGEGRGFEYASSWSLHPEELVSEVIPEFSGVADVYENSYWGRNAFKDNSEYGGLVVLLLAIYCLLGTSFKDRWVFLALGALATTYALGAHTPVFTLFYHVVPNVKQLRAPSMIMFVYVFSIVLCAGAALDAYVDAAGKSGSIRRSKWFWSAAGVLGAGALLFSLAPSAMMSMYRSVVYSDLPADKAAVLARHQDAISLGTWVAALLAVALAYLMRRVAKGAWRWAFAGIALLVAIDTVRMDRRFIEVVDLNRFFPHEPVVDFLRQQPQPTRVLPLPGGFRTNYFALEGVQEVSGYHGNQLRTYNDFLGGPQQPRLYAKQALDLASVEFLIFRRDVNLSEDPDLPHIEKVFDRAGVVAFRNLDALPRARLVNRWELDSPTDSLYDRLYDPLFDYRNVALVATAPSFASRPDGTPAGEAHIEQYEYNRVSVRTTAPDTALLVLSDNYYPAWQARVNGEPAEILRTNATFRGVVVPPGESLVQFEFHSRRFAMGIWLSLSAALVCIVVAVFPALKRGSRT